MTHIFAALLGHLLALPITLMDALTDPTDEHRRADAALVLVVVLLIAGWACGVFED